MLNPMRELRFAKAKFLYYRCFWRQSVDGVEWREVLSAHSIRLVRQSSYDISKDEKQGAFQR